MTAQIALKKFFGYSGFRENQSEIIDDILNGTNVLAVLPTGAGKSICYQIPALISDNFSIVISPLIALMKDQVDALNKKEEIAAFINSTMSFREVEKALNDIAFGKVKLLYLAPEKLESKEFAERIKNLNPNYLFIDEAHCISEWGHNFRPSYTKIKDFIKFTGIKKISAFTATATSAVITDIIKQLQIKDIKVIVKGFERENLFINVEITKKKKERCYEILKQYGHPAIIYNSSRKQAQELSEYLNIRKINAAFYHAGLDPISRRKIQDEFMSGNLPVIAATNAFGMGIDKKDIRLVIHSTVPGSIENYYQEIGRAGRDGKNSFTWLLFDESDLLIHNYFISNSYPNKEIIQQIYSGICDYSRIAIGDKPDKEIPVDKQYLKLYTKEDLSDAIINSSLNFLSEASYLRMNSALDASDKIQILFEAEKLKKFVKKVRNEKLKDLIVYLIRKFGNEIFNNKIKFNKNIAVKESGLSVSELEESLGILENLGIVEFFPSPGKLSVTLLQPRIKVEELKLNFKLINELYIYARQKLDRMIDYVYTDKCRMRFILEYFGEDCSDFKCGKCDNCNSSQLDSDKNYEFLKQTILNLFSDQSDQLEEVTLIDQLTGKTSSSGRNKISSNSPFSKSDLITVLKQLVDSGILTKSKQKNKKSYYLSSAKQSEESEPKIIANKIDYNLQLFHQLREVRDRASKKFLQSQGIICPDNLLAEISRKRPHLKSELMKIHGFTERMFNKIGNDLLEVITSFSEDKIPDNNVSIKDRIPENIHDTYKLLLKKYNLKEIAETRKLNEAIISMQIESILAYEPETDISHIVSKEVIKEIEMNYVKGMTDLKEIKNNLSKNISYPVIRIAIAKIKSAS